MTSAPSHFDSLDEYLKSSNRVRKTNTVPPKFSVFDTLELVFDMDRGRGKTVFSRMKQKYVESIKCDTTMFHGCSRATPIMDICHVRAIISLAASQIRMTLDKKNELFEKFGSNFSALETCLERIQTLEDENSSLKEYVARLEEQLITPTNGNIATPRDSPRPRPTWVQADNVWVRL